MSDTPFQTHPEVFHTFDSPLRQHVHIVLTRPEIGGNVGAILRSAENLGIFGNIMLIGPPTALDESCRVRAKHAAHRMEAIGVFDSLEQVQQKLPSNTLYIAATQRVGSSKRPHPARVRDAIALAARKLEVGEVSDIALVFGPENHGLRNDEVALCDWVVEIPTSPSYRSLNLSHAVTIFAYEFNDVWLSKPQLTAKFDKVSQKERMIEHCLRVAEKVGFILPGDPYKMRPRLERIFENLPVHIPEAKTLHGLLGQIGRSVEKGRPDYKKKYQRNVISESQPLKGID